MTVGRLSLLVGMLLAVSTASAGFAAGTPSWRVAVRAHKPQDWSAQPLIQARMPVALVAGRRQPQALALRLVVRRHGQLGRQGYFEYGITCGGWRRSGRTAMDAKTPVTLQIPFRVPKRASGVPDAYGRGPRFCTIVAGGGGAAASDEYTLDLLCRAKSRGWCVPYKPFDE